MSSTDLLALCRANAVALYGTSDVFTFSVPRNNAYTGIESTRLVVAAAGTAEGSHTKHIFSAESHSTQEALKDLLKKLQVMLGDVHSEEYAKAKVEMLSKST